MMLDAKITEFRPESVCNDGRLERLTLMDEDICGGARIVVLPEGIRTIAPFVFESYNKSALVNRARYLILHPDQQLSEWSKNLGRRQPVRISLPREAGNTIAEKAAFLSKKERDIRLLQMHLPASLTDISFDAFPVLLERITVDDDNPFFASVEGVLFSKDKKTLIRYPGAQEDQSYEIPEGTERIAAGAFSHAILKRLVIPESVRRIDEYAFMGVTGLNEIMCDTDHVEMGTSLFAGSKLKGLDWWPFETIPRACFINSDISLIGIPQGVRRIEKYAFAGCTGSAKIIIPGSVIFLDQDAFEGVGYFSGDVSLPEHLMKHLFKLPPLFRVNGRQKSDLAGEDIALFLGEDTQLLKKRREQLQRYLNALKPFQFFLKKPVQREVSMLDRLIITCEKGNCENEKNAVA